MHPTDSDFMRELLTVFVAEAEERLQVIDTRLLELEREPDSTRVTELLDDLMRELHTLKGSAGAVDLPDIGRLAHALESYLRQLGESPADRGRILDRGYTGLDGMRALVQAARDGRGDGADVDALLADLTKDAVQNPVDGVVPPEGAQTSNDSVWQPVDSPDDSASVHSGLEGDGDASASHGPNLDRAEGASDGGLGRAAPRASVAEGVDDVVRVSTDKLDSLMARVGELVITTTGAEARSLALRELSDAIAGWERSWAQMRSRYRRLAEMREESAEAAGALLAAEFERLIPELDDGETRLAEISRRVNEVRADLDANERRLGQVADDIESEVRRTRMLPVSTIVTPLYRIARDTARELHREVDVEVTGAETEVDRSVLESLRGPLTHLIRNAVDHGVEEPDVRERLGKPRNGRVQIAATQRAGSLLLSISDDGAGIDPDAVRAEARSLGLISDDEAETWDQRELLRLIFRPNLSTRGGVTDISGRGVGLDVVYEAIERLGGVVDVASTRGSGTTFTLSVPLSVATTQSVLLTVADTMFALPIGSVSRIASVDASQMGRAQGSDVVVLDDGPVVVVHLNDILQMPGAGDRGEGPWPVVVIGSDAGRLGLMVDGLHGTHDVVVKPLPAPLERVSNVAGAAVLATGKIAVVINTADVLRYAASVADWRTSSTGGSAAGKRPRASILVADDSLVTRTLEKGILEAAGYSVRVAVNGAEALRMLREAPADCVVSDVNMPVMDGLALARAIRSDKELGETPIVLVTSRGDDDDKRRGSEAGANAYIVKSSFSHDGLVDTVQRLAVPRVSRA